MWDQAVNVPTQRIHFKLLLYTFYICLGCIVAGLSNQLLIMESIRVTILTFICDPAEIF